MGDKDQGLTRQASPASSPTPPTPSKTPDRRKLKKSRITRLLYDDDVLDQHLSPLIRRAKKPLDIIVVILILVNTVIIFMHMQWEGYKASVLLGIESAGGWHGADDAFSVVEKVFTVVFVVELMVRLRLYR